MSWVFTLILKGSKKFRSFSVEYEHRDPSPQNQPTWRTCAGDQRAGGPENSLALRVERTRASGWPSNVGDNNSITSWICTGNYSVSNWHVTKYSFLSFVAHVEIHALSRGTKRRIETALFQEVFQLKKNYLVRVFGANSNAALISLVLWVLNNWEFVLRDWGWGRLFHKARLEGLLDSWVVQIPTFLHVFKMVEATFRGYSPSLSSKILPLLLLNTSSMEIVLFTDQAWF